MAKRNPAPPAAEPGHNSGLSREQLGQIEQLTRRIKALENDRGAINDDISAARSEIKALGIDMDAWRAAKRRMEMDPEDRNNFDKSQEICNAALGVPIQPDLFAADPNDDGDLPGAND